MKPQTIDSITFFLVLTAQLVAAIGGIYAAYRGHWFAGLLCFWLAASFKWRKDGKWLPDQEDKP